MRAPDLKGANYPPKDCPVHFQLMLLAFPLFLFLLGLPCFLAYKVGTVVCEQLRKQMLFPFSVEVIQQL